MEILPAIDLRGGKVVRLYQGDYARETVFGDDPAATAEGFAKAGAKNIHIVDLDGAKAGRPVNAELIAEMLRRSGLRAEIGGGIRSRETAEKYLAIGAERVILGTAAVKNFAFTAEMAREFGSRVAVGVDARDGRVAVDGWTETSREDSFEFVRRLAEAGVKTVVYTDIACDGASRGTNLAAYARLGEIDINVIASGGIGSFSDLDALEKTGVWGAIVGKALYTGALDLRKTLERYQK